MGRAIHTLGSITPPWPEGPCVQGLEVTSSMSVTLLARWTQGCPGCRSPVGQVGAVPSSPRSAASGRDRITWAGCWVRMPW